MFGCVLQLEHWDLEVELENHLEEMERNWATSLSEGAVTPD